MRRGLSAFTDNKINVTFSIDKPVYEELKQEADAQKTSLNAKVNHVLDMYIKFYRIAARFESKTIPHQQFAAMLELMEERGLIKILIDIGNHDIMSSFHQNEIPFTIDSLIINCFEGVALWTGFCASFNYYLDEERHLNLVFTHRLGAKWSRVVAAVISDLIKQTLNVPTKIQTLANTAIVKVVDKRIVPTSLERRI